MNLCHLNIIWTKDAGVLKKLSHQVQALRSAQSGLGRVECLVVIRRDEQTLSKPLPGISTLPITVPGPSIVQEALLPFLVWSKLKKRLNSFDVIVTRWTIPSPFFLKVVRKKPVFTEHHTKELEEASLVRGLKPFVRTLLEKTYAPTILRNARGIIGVTDEIRRYELGRAGLERPSITLSNGISPEEVPFTPSSPFKGGALNLVFVSSHFAPWHGLDRLLEGMVLYLKTRGSLNCRVRLHLIGRLTSKQIRTIRHSRLNSNVVTHGYLFKKDLDKVLGSCHLAIGSLALHRIGMAEACALKVREYTARGLPFVIGYDDPDLPDHLPWVYRVPPNESPIEIDQLISFAKSTTEFPFLAKKMRTYAEKKLSWDVKMRQLLEFVSRHFHTSPRLS